MKTHLINKEGVYDDQLILLIIFKKSQKSQHFTIFSVKRGKIYFLANFFLPHF